MSAAEELLSLLEEDSDGAPDAGPVFDRLGKLAADVPGFSVTPRVVIGNFSYAKMAMVADLETDTEALTGSELICAIAGSKTSRQALRDRQPTAQLNEPDFVPPADEFLVLDADASQSYVVNAASPRGRSGCPRPARYRQEPDHREPYCDPRRTWSDRIVRGRKAGGHRCCARSAHQGGPFRHRSGPARRTRLEA